METFLCVYTHQNHTCLQGMFHPARKVRDVYWKIYNSLYIGSQVRASSVVIVLWFKLFLPVRSCLCEDAFKKSCWIGHFRIHFSLYFQASLRANSLLWISVVIHIETRTNDRNKHLHLDSLWKRDCEELLVFWGLICQTLCPCPSPLVVSIFGAQFPTFSVYTKEKTLQPGPWALVTRSLLVSRVCLDFCPLVSRPNQRQLAVFSLCCGLFFSFQDSLVAAYPTAPSDDKNNFVRSELTYFLWIHLLLFSRTTIYCVVTPILKNCGVRPKTWAALQCWFLKRGCL